MKIREAYMADLEKIEVKQVNPMFILGIIMSIMLCVSGFLLEKTYNRVDQTADGVNALNAKFERMQGNYSNLNDNYKDLNSRVTNLEEYIYSNKKK